MVFERKTKMHIIQADCEVKYDGRGNTYLERGQRLIMIKADNSVAIHQDKGIRPLNYMTKAVSITDEFDNETKILHLYVKSTKEQLHIIIHEVLFEMHLDFDEDKDLIHTGTEKQLQAWLAEENNFHNTFGEDIQFITREYQTTKGAVDLLGQADEDEQVVLIEVKRTAKRNDVFQLTRYRTALHELYDNAVEAGDKEIITVQDKKKAVPLPTHTIKDPHAYLVASKMLNGVKEECEKQKILPFEVGYEWTKKKE